MKTNNIILIIMILLFASLLIFGCKKGSSKNDTGEYTSVLFDRTDSIPITISLNDLKRTMNPDLWAAKKVRISTINESAYSQTYEYSLSQSGRFADNELRRKVKVKKFWDSIGGAIDKINSSATVSERSSVYQKIAMTLNDMAEDKTTHRTLIVISDLREHTSFFSAYKKSDLRKLKEDPEKVMSQFSEKFPLENLKGIEVVFIYQTPAYEDSEVYSTVSNWYKKLLEAKGAHVSIKTNL